MLLQVLFHARIAEDAPQHPFTIDEVADSLVRKLGNRVPAVLAGEAISLDEQLAQWEERKALEKSRSSSMDDVPTGQPALALAQKVIERVTVARLPADLIPAAITAVSVSADVDAENSLRSAVLEFMDTVRRTEHAIAAGRRDEDVPEALDAAALGEITDEEWRAYWPSTAQGQPEGVGNRAVAGSSPRAVARCGAGADAHRRARARPCRSTGAVAPGRRGSRARRRQRLRTGRSVRRSGNNRRFQIDRSPRARRSRRLPGVADLVPSRGTMATTEVG